MDALHPGWIITFSTLLAAFPLFVGACSAYLKVSIVLGFMRSGLGAQQTPGALVVSALSIAITIVVMSPTFRLTSEKMQQLDPNMFSRSPRIEDFKAIAATASPWVLYMQTQTGLRELEAVRRLAAPPQNTNSNQSLEPQQSEAPEAAVVALAYLLTQLRQAFCMGFVFLLPFLVVDLLVANILVGMGLSMVSPVMVALPLKLLIFVLADGWLLVVKGLLHSFVS